MKTKYKVIQAGIADLEQVSSLFDRYRQFYQQKADIALARDFIAERITNNSSVIFLAIDNDNNALGFTQLYPSYCSVEAKPILILYDLFVDDRARNQGVAKALMNRALELAKMTQACRIDLETAKDNHQAQALYQSLGYQLDNDYDKYYLEDF